MEQGGAASIDRALYLCPKVGQDQEGSAEAVISEEENSVGPRLS